MRKALLFGGLLIVVGVSVAAFSVIVFGAAGDIQSNQRRNEVEAARLLTEAEAVKTSNPERAADLVSDAARRADFAAQDAAEYEQQRSLGFLSATGGGMLLVTGIVLTVIGLRPRKGVAGVPAYAPPPGYPHQPPGFGQPQAGYAPPPGFARPPGPGQPPPGYGPSPGHGQPPPGYGPPPGHGQPPPGYGR